jgi:hypothetical protein
MWLFCCTAYPEDVLECIERRPFIAQLELEEAFFLAYAVGWLQIKDSVSMIHPLMDRMQVSNAVK